jgi:membrane protein implicated in regulation of membrane protease activity
VTEFLTGWTLQLLAVVGATAIVCLAVYGLMRLMAKPQIRVLSPGLVGVEGVALTPISRREGKVDVAGNRFIAISDEPIDAGKKVRVVRVEGVVAKVEPVPG